MPNLTDCPNCLAGGLRLFHEARSVPTNNCILLDTRQEAVAYPRGDIALGFCDECGFITNCAFDEKLTEYSGRCEETQGFSPTFSAFHRELASRVVERFDLSGKTILEIGCGKGEFLLLLCEAGASSGVGFDPAYVPERVQSAAANRVRFVTDFYSEKYAQEKADFVCCKMTLEHIHPTARFIETVRRAIGDRPETVVFFQVPDATRILSDCAFEDVYYEHCSYFSPCSLGRLFSDRGFEVMNVDSEYGGQYLTIEARPRLGDATGGGAANAAEVRKLAGLVDEFPGKLQERIGRWRDRFAEVRRHGQKAVLWGSGSKGVAFLSTIGVAEEVAYAVDINPYRHGSHMPGSGLEIVSPDFLKEYRPDLVIIMNAIYRQEIGKNLAELGLEPEILAV